MKTRNKLFKISAFAAVLTLNVGLYTALNKTPQKVDAYSVSSLPTTIDLNDCNEQTIRSYYSSLNSLSESERQGTNLLKNLKTILKNNQKYLSYDSGNSVWDVYCIVDRDWNKSPASSLPAAAGTYDSVTNKITNYHWGNNSATYENPYLHALYYNRENEPVARAYGDHGNGINNPTGINREHIWPKGAGFEDKSSGGARGDIMHLWAAHGHTNNKHSNFYYGYVDKTRAYKDEKTDTAECAGNLLGYSETLGGNTSVFEPQDSDKGDIARACFYMAARYNYLSGSDSDGIDSNNPNLELVNNVSSFQSKGYASTTSTTGKLGILQDLLDWNRLDPPDEFEIHRNNLCYNNFTNNRNPFIDFPSWADAIWGTVDEEGNYNPAITTSASPASDPINTGSTATLSISNSELNLQVNDTAEIYAANADSAITWSIADNTVANLNKASTSNNEVVTVTALKSGTTTITATSGGNNVTCTVTVGQALNYGTLENPLSVDEAIELVSITGNSETAKPLYVKGIVSSNHAYNTTYKNFDYAWLQNNDGSKANAFELFRFKLDAGISGDYTATDSMVGKEVIAYGYGQVYNNTTPELTTSKTKTPKNPLVYEINEPGAAKVDLKNASTYAKLTANESLAPISSTITKTTNQLVEQYGWNVSSGSANGLYTDFNLDSNINISTTGKPNCGSVWGTGTYDWRLYQNKSGNIIITANNDCLITSVKLGYNSQDSGVLKHGNTTVSSNTAFAVDYLSSVILTVGNTGDATNGKVKITSFSVTYSGQRVIADSASIIYDATIPTSDWQTIEDGWGIDDYGFMVFRTEAENIGIINTVKEYYELNPSKVTIVRNNGGTPPDIVNGCYQFSIQINIVTISKYSRYYIAAPFIVADGNYYFLEELRYSVNTLADYFLTNGGSDLSDAALQYLAEAN